MCRSICTAVGIPVSVYKPSECAHQKSPVILVYFHGGGNTQGTRETHESICKIIARLEKLFFNLVILMLAGWQ